MAYLKEYQICPYILLQTRDNYVRSAWNAHTALVTLPREKYVWVVFSTKVWKHVSIYFVPPQVENVWKVEKVYKIIHKD